MRERTRKFRIPLIAVGIFVLCTIPLILLLASISKDGMAQSYDSTQTSRPPGIGDPVGDGFSEKIVRVSPIPPTGTIKVGDDSFEGIYNEVYAKPDQYIGREIEVSGMVVRDSRLEKNQFLIARKLRWCCEDDQYLIGYIVRWNKEMPEDGSFKKIKGRILGKEFVDKAKRVRPTPFIEGGGVEHVADLSVQVYPSPFVSPMTIPGSGKQ